MLLDLEFLLLLFLLQERRLVCGDGCGEAGNVEQMDAKIVVVEE